MHAWNGRAVLAVIAIAVALPAARGQEPAGEAAAREAERLLRAGIQVLQGAAGQDEDQPPADPKAAAAKQRQQQIDQQAQQMQQFFQPVLQAELELARKTCGSLPPEARKQILAAGNAAVKAVARQFAEQQFTGRGRKGFDARNAIHDAVAAAVKPHAPAEEFAACSRS